LAISSANQDLANSDALKIARQVDPKGKRTIGVLTKVDLMDEGTDACELLTGSIYPLKHGYYGVKMRSQLDIKNHVTIRQAKKNEVKYFSNHDSYKDNMEQLGVPNLTAALNRILVSHLKECIPAL